MNFKKVKTQTDRLKNSLQNSIFTFSKLIFFLKLFYIRKLKNREKISFIFCRRNLIISERNIKNTIEIFECKIIIYER